MKKEEIRSALEGTSAETLADALAIFLTEGKAPSQSATGKSRPELANFAQAVIYLRNNYDFVELDYFTTEADLVYVQAGDRRILLTDRTNASAGNERAAFETKNSNRREKEEDEQESPDSGSNGSRFSNLEI